MSFSMLMDGRFDDYVAAAQKDARLWLLVHVPKTAGSSLSTELARLQPPYHNIHIDHLDRSRPAINRFDDAVSEFLEMMPERKFRSASGHIHNRHMQTICAAVEGVRPLAMLRHPLSRLVSDYRYQRSDMHPLNKEVAQRTPDFESFIKLPGQRNRMARHLVPAELIRQGDVAGCVDYILKTFTFVGVQERYTLHFAATTALIGASATPPTEKKRVNEGGLKVDVSPSTAEEVKALNAVDFGIYDALFTRLSSVEEGLAEWLARVQS